MKLTSQKGRGNKIHLLIDAEYVITTDVDFWYAHYIADDTELSEEEWEAFCEKITVRKAFNKALDLLSRRDHGKIELSKKLRRTFDEEITNKAVERMSELGYIDDQKFASCLITYLLEVKKFSLSRVKQELRMRGIDRELISDLLSEVETDPVAQVFSLLDTKYRRQLIDEKGKKRTVSALQRLGYSYSDIRSAFYRFDSEIDTYEE